MAKQPVYSKDDDLLQIPLDQEVVVAITPEDDDEVVAAPEDKKTPAKTPEIDVDADSIKSLNDQLEALKASNQMAEKQLKAEQRRAREAEQAARGLAQEASQFRAVAENSHHETLKSALATAQAEQETHKKDYMSYLEAGDFMNAAEAQAKMSRAAAKIVDAEKSLAYFEIEKSSQPERRPEPPRQAAQQVEEEDIISSIDKNPSWLPKEKEYLKAHPELLTDGQKNAELGVAYQRAMRENISRGTPEYFEFLDKFMGYKKAETADDDADAGNTAAPVRRENAGGRAPVRPNQVKLTPAMREMARNMGISETGYAKQYLKLQAEKVANPEKYNQSR